MIDTLILAGGRGTRAASYLGTTPKALAPVRGRPLVEHLLDQLEEAGAGRVVLSLGQGASAVIKHLACNPREGLEVVALVELRALGTGGALRLARPLLRSEPVLVMNGDTLVDCDLAPVISCHRRQNIGGVTILGRTGVHAGVYLFSQRSLDDLGEPEFSDIVEKHATDWWRVRGFVDIGTQEGFERANLA